MDVDDRLSPWYREAAFFMVKCCKRHGAKGGDDSPMTLETIRNYHQATKHHMNRYARSLGYMDWDTQPDPFRTYEGAPRIDLEKREPAEADTLPYDEAFRPGAVPAAPLDLQSLAQFFYDSLALSAWKSAGKNRWALRVNPSSGNLHPTEAYLLAGPNPGLGDASGAVCHYSPKTHTLEKRAVVPDDLWADLAGGLPEGAFLIGLTSIYWRESWKYGERAFRYCHHDVGHAIAALAVAAAGLGWQVRLVENLSSDRMDTLLGVRTQQGMEAEHADCLLAVWPQGTAGCADHADRADAGSAGGSGKPVLLVNPAAAERFADLDWQGKENVLSHSHTEWPIIDHASEATRKPEGEPQYLFQKRTVPSHPDAAPSQEQRTAATGHASDTAPLRKAAAPGTPRPPRDATLRRIIRTRRSAYEMDGVTTMSSEAFYLLLERLLPSAGALPYQALPWEPLAHLILFVHRVDGLEPGIYALPRTPEQKAALQAACRDSFLWQKPEGCPAHLDLHLLQPTDARDLSKGMSCHQDIASDSCFSLGMLTEYDRPLEQYGAWFYPRLYWECGLIGQMLYLEAEAAGVRGTGIGCFFDDLLLKTLGLEGTRWQDLYHFTVGGPVDDPRLGTTPAYV